MFTTLAGSHRLEFEGFDVNWTNNRNGVFIFYQNNNLILDNIFKEILIYNYEI